MVTECSKQVRGTIHFALSACYRLIFFRSIASLGFLIIPEIRKIIDSFVEQIISETDFQMSSESWSLDLCAINLYPYFKRFSAAKIVEKRAPPKLLAMVMYGLIASESDQINLHKGHIITVVEKAEEEGWWVGVDEAGDGKTGYFPSNYVKLLPPENFSVHSLRVISDKEKQSLSESAIVAHGAPVYGWMVSIGNLMIIFVVIVRL